MHLARDADERPPDGLLVHEAHAVGQEASEGLGVCLICELGDLPDEKPGRTRLIPSIELPDREPGRVSARGVEDSPSSGIGELVWCEATIATKAGGEVR